MEDIDIVPATYEDREKVFRFLCEHFYPDEPLDQFLEIDPPGKINDCASPKLLQAGCSFLAISKSEPGEIRAVVLNEEISKNDPKPEWLELSKQCEGKPYGKLMEFLHVTHDAFLKVVDAECWSPTNTLTGLEVTMIATHRSYRGRNIGKRLLEITESLARERNHRWLFIECTSAFSAALAQKHAFKSIYKLPYSEYKDRNGLVVFAPPAPHVMLNCFVKDLNDS